MQLFRMSRSVRYGWIWWPVIALSIVGSLAGTIWTSIQRDNPHFYGMVLTLGSMFAIAAVGAAYSYLYHTLLKVRTDWRPMVLDSILPLGAMFACPLFAGYGLKKQKAILLNRQR
jgi:hypothetical protein